MTIKFSSISGDNTGLAIADGPNLTFDGDFAIVVGVVMNGKMTTAEGGGTYQTLYHTGGYQTAGNLIGMIYPLDTVTTGMGGKVAFHLAGGTSSRCTSAIALEASKAYVIVLQRSSGVFVSKICPVLTSSPVDGSAVSTGGTYGSAAVLDGPSGLNIGWHSTNNRRLDQSICRLAYIKRALTDLEIAQLAYGKEITTLGAPEIYLRMNDASDYGDTGAQANVVTPTGTLSQGAAMGFGFDSTPTAPVFGSAPVISGAAVVGGTISYTGGAVTGNPSPAVTFQWVRSDTLAGAQTDIVGATASTYSPVSGDAAKFVRIKLAASNGVGSTVTSTSDALLVSSTAVELSLVDFTAEAIYQRAAGSANGRATVPMSGGFVGAAPSSIEAQIYDAAALNILRSWFDVGATIGASTWAAAPLIDAPTDRQKYRVQLRSKNSGGATLAQTATSGRFGVGDRIVIIGSSSPATYSGSGSGSNKAPDANVVSTVYSGAWSLFDSYGIASGMAEHFAGKTGVPTALINIALGGSSLKDWADTGSPLWTRMTGLLSFIGPKLAGLFGAAGSNDITSSTAALTVDAHLAKLRAVAANTRAATGQPDLPVLWIGINRRYDALALQANNARAAERAFGNDPSVYYIQILDIEVKDPNDPVNPGDGIHPTINGYIATDARIRYVWSSAVYDGVYHKGPIITGIAYSGNKATVTVAHRNAAAADMSPAAGITGFAVVDDGGEVGVTSVERADGTRISITCDRVLVNPQITYLAGAWVDNAATVFDNAPTALPLMAEPFAVAGAGAVYSTFSKSFTISYNVAAADGGGTPADTTAPVLTGVIAQSNVTSSGFTHSCPVATDNVGVVGYESSIDGGAAYTDRGTTRTVTETGKLAATAYSVRWRAYDGAGLRSAALALTITTLAAADTTGPSLGGAITITATTSTGFAFSWPAATDSVGVAGYEYSINGGTSYASTGMQQSASPTGLTPSTLYQIRARAFDAAGNRSASLSTVITTSAGSSMSYTPSASRMITVQPGQAAFSVGSSGFWTMTDPKKPRAVKDSDSKIDIPFDWTPWLADIADSISTVMFLADGGLVIEGFGFVAGVATVFVSAGTASGTVRASITCRITTASSPSRIEDRTVYLDIESR